MKNTIYGRNPGFNMPKKKLPQSLLHELESFVESESVDREARIYDLAVTYGVEVNDILEHLRIDKDN